jgi:hypothetical protein
MADPPEICWRKNRVRMTSRRLVFAMVLSAIVLTRGLWPQTQERREIMVKAALNDLRSADPKVVSNAAVQLGEWKIKAAVPALLEVLQSPDSLTIPEHVTTVGMRRWIAIDPKWRIVEALGAIGDKRAVPLLERYLRAPPAGLELAAQNLASALFLITGLRYRYRDDQGNSKRYAPEGFEEEEVRRRLRPDLVPVGDLTAALEIMATGRRPLADDSGSWLGSQPLIIGVSITNHSALDRNSGNTAFQAAFSRTTDSDLVAAI